MTEGPEGGGRAVVEGTPQGCSKYGKIWLALSGLTFGQARQSVQRLFHGPILGQRRRLGWPVVRVERLGSQGKFRRVVSRRSSRRSVLDKTVGWRVESRKVHGRCGCSMVYTARVLRHAVPPLSRTEPKPKGRSRRQRHGTRGRVAVIRRGSWRTHRHLPRHLGRWASEYPSLLGEHLQDGVQDTTQS